MAVDDEEIRKKNRIPGPEVTPKLFRQWQTARRGSTDAEDMTNPVWLWLFRGRVDPYHANERFKSRLGKLLGTVALPSEPGWAGCRMGQSRTELSDGRVFWIAGEHEDYYDPDFYIYNDVIVEHGDGEVRIFGYPETRFPPTDFHSATAIDDEQTILLVGSIGYSAQREVGRTQVYALNTATLAIEEIASEGEPPGWISQHDARLNDSGTAVLISGGQILTEDGFLENIDEWSLSLGDFCWTRLTQRKWIRLQVARTDQTGLHLWNYDMRKFALDHPGAGFDREDDLADQIGAEPNMEAYDSLCRPPVPHTPIVQSDADEEDWRTKRIIIEGVPVRYTDDMDHLTVTVEGELPDKIVKAIAEDLRAKLSLVENCDTQIKWINSLSPM
ncbi:hypothetical protein [Roseimaritima ulvae]|uniref:Uncharacterized protein n=1 Tax=Roseimaritima ulvae TaxID=980254 RepID=A0A5B9QN75_9BACT|nr:hypothetical protein [Roseimaritima ulvae]QEG39332.1 hypothetical protein UC8_12970 [Roseimaritima ulvae]